MSSNDWPAHQEELRRQHAERELVKAARVLLAERLGIDEGEAVRRLVRVAQSQRRLVFEVAADVVRTGGLPDT